MANQYEKLIQMLRESLQRDERLTDELRALDQNTVSAEEAAVPLNLDESLDLKQLLKALAEVMQNSIKAIDRVVLSTTVKPREDNDESRVTTA